MKKNKNEYKRVISFFMIVTLFLSCLSLRGVFAQENTTPSGYGLSNPATDSEGTVTWDCVYFGNYWQNDTNGDGTADKADDKEPIKWRVLSVNGDDALLLADKGLDCQKYNEIGTDVTWETCTLRSWLNGYGTDETDNFLIHAFDDSEQKAIRKTNIINEDNPIHNTEGGNDTTDSIFLLSYNEAKNLSYGFSESEEDSPTRQMRSTVFAKSQGVRSYDASTIKDIGFWWLRSPGAEKYFASFVSEKGGDRQHGVHVNDDDYAIRPALHIKLSETSCWRNAGKVTSKGEEIPPVTPTPKPTESPVVTEQPEKTAEPTQTPAETEHPTESPSATPKVLPTESPVVTEKPEKTTEPTQTPAETEYPTESPSVMPTVLPSESPTETEPPVNTPKQTIPPISSIQPSLIPAKTPAVTKSPATDKNLPAIMDGLGVSEEIAIQITRMATELNVANDTILVTEQTILSQKTDEDIKGAYFARIQAKASQITQKNIKLSWNRVKGADGYEIYGNRCNTKKWIYEYKRMKTITNPNKKLFIDRNCKKGTYYKYIVRAYKIIGGKKVTIAASKTIHVTTTGGKNGNAKSVKINKKKFSLKPGKTYKIRAKEVKDIKPLRHHREVSYESGNPDIATVSKRGVVKAKKKGRCTIYAYAQNGKYKKVKVSVK